MVLGKGIAGATPRSPPWWRPAGWWTSWPRARAHSSMPRPSPIIPPCARPELRTIEYLRRHRLIERAAAMGTVLQQRFRVAVVSLRWGCAGQGPAGRHRVRGGQATRRPFPKSARFAETVATHALAGAGGLAQRRTAGGRHRGSGICWHRHSSSKRSRSMRWWYSSVRQSGR